MEGLPRPVIEEGRLTAVLAESWGLEMTALQYVPKGSAGYHWTGAAADGSRWFVKLDGLEAKPYLGENPSSARAGLEVAYGTAHLLAAAGLEFVVAPVPTRVGKILEPVDPHWTLALFPFVPGAAGEWGRRGPAGRRGSLIRALARLHAVGPAVRSRAATRGWELPGRAGLEGALEDVISPWSGGPFSEPTRQVLRGNREMVREWLATLDSLASAVAAAGPALVVTHGEPHPGNVMTDGHELRLIDWDTVAQAPAERDLWMFGDDPGALDAYAVESGHGADPTALAFYRLTWALSDLASFTDALRRPHDRNPATEHSWRGLLSILEGSEPAPYGPSGGRR